MAKGKVIPVRQKYAEDVRAVSTEWLKGFGSMAGDDGSMAGDDGSMAGDDGSMAGDDGSMAGEDGSLVRARDGGGMLSDQIS